MTESSGLLGREVEAALIVGPFGMAPPAIQAGELKFGRLSAVEAERGPQRGGLSVPGFDRFERAGGAQPAVDGVLGGKRLSQ